VSEGAGPATIQLSQRLRALGVAGTLLQLGAHPDDEESGMLALVARGRGARAVYWSATRGEGGQNKRGGERGDALGVLRSWESVDAREVDGAEALFGPFIDFGFSKSGEDALRRWGREDVVRELVRAIRTVQPLVLVGRWTGTPVAGHGHHQAIGMVTAAAIDAAADPDRFAELGLPAWTPAKVYRSLAGDWQPGEDGELGGRIAEHEGGGRVGVDAGALDPLTGLTYQEIAHVAMNRHRSQGLGFVSAPGPYLYYYRAERPGGLTGERSLYDGLDTSLAGLADHPGGQTPRLRERLAAIGALADEALECFRPHEPWLAAPALLRGLDALRELVGDLHDGDAALAVALRRRADEFERVAALCLGVRLEATADRARATPGHGVGVRVQVHSGGPHEVSVERVDLELPPGWSAKSRGDGTFAISVPPDAPPQAPYWLRAPHGPHRYVWPQDAAGLGEATDRPLVVAVADVVTAAGHRLTLRETAIERAGFTGGQRTLPVSVVPEVALVPREARAILPVSAQETVLACDVLVRCIEPNGAGGTVALHAPEGWRVEPAAATYQLAASGHSRTLQFTVTIPAGAPQAAYELIYDGIELRPVRMGAPGVPGPVDEHSCIAEANLVRRAKLEVDLVDVEFVRTLSYGYVRGAEEPIPEALARFGVDLAELSDDDLAYGDLGTFDAIVIGPNAYNVRGEVRRHARRLLDYVAEGGTMVVQYQGYGYDAPGLAPHPFRFSQPHDRVTDPSAPVQLVDPAHAVLHTPNAIGPADFDGWVHDRGMYFFGEWARQYTPVLACCDTGEPPRLGGLLTAVHGRGAYVYTGLSFHRQIPAGVPGAIRLFANVLALAEARIRERMDRLREIELFGYMNEDELYAAARIMSERWLDAGAVLAQEGEPGHELFVLVDGSIEVVKHLSGGDRVLHVAQPGESIGELALLAGRERSASLRAATDAVVLVLREDAFDNWLEANPSLGRRLLRLLARRVVDRDPGD
jgi:LmbE family N-acetylglucosaminyl deacetylase